MVGAWALAGLRGGILVGGTLGGAVGVLLGGDLNILVLLPALLLGFVIGAPIGGTVGVLLGALDGLVLAYLPVVAGALIAAALSRWLPPAGDPRAPRRWCWALVLRHPGPQ